MITTHKSPQTETHSLKYRKQERSIEYHKKKNRQKHKGKGPMEAQTYQEMKDKMAIGNSHSSIIILRVNLLNSPI